MIYTREIEGMGEGLVLFNIKVNPKSIGQNYHYYFENRIKPPLDFAINPKNKMIEYISFFVQDEKITEKSLDLNIILENNNIQITSDDFDENNLEKTYERIFDINLDGANIYVIDKDSYGDLNGYEVMADTYILFDKNMIFRGLFLKNISDKEMNEMKESRVI